MRKKLNMFQRTMLRWRDLHPYSAVHVVLVERALDAARLKDAIARELETLGLTNFELDRAHGRYEWHGGKEEVDLKLIPGDDAPSLVDQEIARQLNIPFAPDGRARLFRFFAIDAGASFRFGLAYDHFVAGGDSIVRLLGGIVGRYRGEPAAPAAIDASSAPSYSSLFLRQLGPMLRGLGSLRAIAASLRRSFRPSYTAIEDGRNDFVCLRLGPTESAAMVRAAKDWGVTQNDLFVTILLMALSPLAVQRRQDPNRRDLAVASIVNIRRDFRSDAQHAFAPLLASFRISEPVPDGISVKELAQSVHTESQRIRQGKLYLQTLLGLGLAAVQWQFLSKDRRYGFFAKHYVVWAGTTPLNVAPLWAQAGSVGPAPEYLRGVSTGPSAPMICAISTVHDVVNVGLTYRTAAFDRDVVERVAADMLSRIESL
jgi:hypothetical protein